MLQNITSGDGLGNLIEGLQKKYGVFTRMDFGETQKGLIILENDKYKIEIFKKKGDKMNTNTNTPSKELLSKVLNLDVYIAYHRCPNNNEIYVEWNDNLGIMSDSSNIYELAIKTKQTFPSLDLNLAATDLNEFWRQANNTSTRSKQWLNI
jgi:hypothetical protein